MAGPSDFHSDDLPDIYPTGPLKVPENPNRRVEPGTKMVRMLELIKEWSDEDPEAKVRLSSLGRARDVDEGADLTGAYVPLRGGMNQPMQILIFSQFTSYLDLIERYLRQEGHDSIQYVPWPPCLPQFDSPAIVYLI